MVKRSLNPTVINGKVVITNKSDYDSVKLSVDEMEEILDDTFQKGKAFIINKAHCEDADCFDCAFGSAEKCLLKEQK